MNPTRNLSFSSNTSDITNALNRNHLVNPFFSRDTIESIANALVGQELSREELLPRISEINLTPNCDFEDQNRVIQNLMEALTRLGNSSR